MKFAEPPRSLSEPFLARNNEAVSIQKRSAEPLRRNIAPTLVPNNEADFMKRRSDNIEYHDYRSMFPF